jgi:pimeloyl-ACP methyl ester carboxylesterase
MIQAIEGFKVQVCTYSFEGEARQISYRSSLQEADKGSAQRGVTHVLLHGIGSGSASWLHQLQFANTQCLSQEGHPNLGEVLAWDAPGYALSTPLNNLAPTPQDYAQQFWAWLDALESQNVRINELTLVGHSLGCLMATAAQSMRPSRVKRLVLLAPAIGYAGATQEVRVSKRDERLKNLNLLGPKGMAEKRGHAMLHAPVSDELLDYVKFIMAQVIPQGYAQATHMLSNADLLKELERVDCALIVASGDQDVITPLASCQSVANKKNVAHQVFTGSGHACHLQSHEQVTQLIFKSSQQVRSA